MRQAQQEAQAAMEAEVVAVVLLAAQAEKVSSSSGSTHKGRHEIRNH